MLYIWDIEEIIENTLNQHNLEINFEFNNQLPAPMCYNVSTNTIRFNYLQINGYKDKMNFKIKETDENFVKLILYHVLGYYFDFKKNKHDTRIIMYGEEDEIEQLKTIIETNAWEYGRTLVPEPLVESYDKMREMDKILLKSH
ncbi:hypothetical protein [Neobacillus niacini]|uniref:hypothetical protein n=1 Tax=Neobacillus niacini TaxID=86668 RepID=UPI00285CFCAF|nr:hypothetical protein [Neobacillus niacini]MDR7000191.1 hypothetical protein [Neobacillus niacini]